MLAPCLSDLVSIVVDAILSVLFMMYGRVITSLFGRVSTSGCVVLLLLVDDLLAAVADGWYWLMIRRVRSEMWMCSVATSQV